MQPFFPDGDVPVVGHRVWRFAGDDDLLCAPDRELREERLELCREPLEPPLTDEAREDGLGDLAPRLLPLFSGVCDAAHGHLDPKEHSPLFIHEWQSPVLGLFLPSLLPR